MKTSPAIFLSLLLLLAGCTSSYQFRVDAIKDPEVDFKQGARFYIVPLDTATDAKSLRYLELKATVSKALEQNGYVATENASGADYTLKIEALKSDPINAIRERLDPVYYQSFGDSRLIASPVLNSKGNIVSYRYHRVYLPPQREFAGYVNQTQQITVYDKLLRLTVIEGSEEDAAEVWTLNIYTRSESQDLRSHIPALVTAAMPYFGARTEGEIEVKLAEDDPDLVYLKAPAL